MSGEQKQKQQNSKNFINVITFYNSVLAKECHTLKKVPAPYPEVYKICSFKNWKQLLTMSFFS